MPKHLPEVPQAVRDYFSPAAAAERQAERERDLKQLKAKLYASATISAIVFTVVGATLYMMIANGAPGWAYPLLVLAMLRK